MNTEPAHGGIFRVGQRVRALGPLGDSPSGDSPGGVYARPGDLLIVRKLLDPSYTYPIAVSHPDITNSSFCVAPSEISPEAIEDPTTINESPTE